MDEVLVVSEVEAGFEVGAEGVVGGGVEAEGRVEFEVGAEAEPEGGSGDGIVAWLEAVAELGAVDGVGAGVEDGPGLEAEASHTGAAAALELLAVELAFVAVHTADALAADTEHIVDIAADKDHILDTADSIVDTAVAAAGTIDLVFEPVPQLADKQLHCSGFGPDHQGQLPTEQQGQPSQL